MAMLRILVLAASIAATASVARAAMITTSDGTIVIGDVTALADGIYTIKTPYGVIKVPAASVVRIDSGNAPPPPPRQTPAPTQQASPAAPLPDMPSASLRFAGSTTIGDELMPALVERYAKMLGATKMHWTIEHNDASEQYFDATSPSADVLTAHLSRHGSATAFTALANGAANVGMASRQVKPEEVQTLAAAGFGTADSTNQEHVLALDGLVVLVNRANPVTTLSLAQLASIFSGETSDWSAVGGTAGPIHVLARDSKSGTADTFKGLVMKDKPVTPAAKLMDSTDGLSDQVASDPAAIGYAGFAYVRRAKAVRILTDCGLDVPPSDFYVRTEEYPLSRRLYLYTGAAQDAKVDGFVGFALGDQGQDEAGKKGFIDLVPRLSVNDYGTNRIATALSMLSGSGSDASAEMRAIQFFNKVAQTGRRISTTFRFRSGSFELDSRAVSDIDRLATAVRSADMSKSQLVILGFSDSKGSVASNVRLSVARARRIAELLQGRGVATKNVFGLGRAAPVACNSSPDGQEKNRRVEIWVIKSGA